MQDCEMPQLALPQATYRTLVQWSICTSPLSHRRKCYVNDNMCVYMSACYCEGILSRTGRLTLVWRATEQRFPAACVGDAVKFNHAAFRVKDGIPVAQTVQREP